MPKTRLLGVYWHTCARCGWTFPEGEIQKNNKGQWICLKYCWDENENEI